MSELALDLSDQFLSLFVHLILRVEQGPSFLIALRFECLDLLLPGKLLLQCQRGCSGTPGFLDLPVEILDLALQADLQVVGPAVELFCFGLEENRPLRSEMLRWMTA